MQLSITGLLQKFFGARQEDRRQHKRFYVRLAASVALLDDKQSQKSFHGYTCNLSEAGIALLLPSIKEDEQELIQVGSSLRVVVAAPSKTLMLSATVVHFGLLDARRPEAGHIVGARIIDKGDSQRVHLIEYLSTL